MKKLILSLFLLGSLTFSGCKKEPLPLPEVLVNLLVDEEPQSLVDSLDSVFFKDPLISDVSPSSDASILDYPEFIDYDPFTSATVRVGKIDSCLKGIEITKAEKESLNKAFSSKLNCQRSNKDLIAKIHRDIELWAKTQKESYYKNWYLTERGKLQDSLKRGLLIESQYKEKISSLERTWAIKMNYINNQVKEKIKASIQRAETIGKIKDCEKIYLNSVLEILGKTRYKKWIECYKYHYRTK